MKLNFGLKKRMDKAREKFPLLRKYPLLLWLSLPLLWIIYKLLTVFVFGSLAALVTGYLKNNYDIEVPGWLMGTALFLILFLLIVLIIRLIRSKRKDTAK